MRAIATDIAVAGNSKLITARSGVSQRKNARDSRNTTSREAKRPDAMPTITPRCFLSKCTVALSAGERSRTPWRRFQALMRLKR